MSAAMPSFYMDQVPVSVNTVTGGAAYVTDAWGKRYPPIPLYARYGSGVVPQVGDTWMIAKEQGAWTFKMRVGYTAPTVVGLSQLFQTLVDFGLIGPDSQGASMVFVDGPSQTLDAPFNTAVVMPGTSGASPSAPVRLHNFLIASNSGGVEIVGASSAKVYLNQSVGVGPYYWDLTVDEPLNLTATGNANTLYYSVATLVSVP